MTVPKCWCAEIPCMQASDLVTAAAMSQLAAAEEAELSVRASLSQQVEAFEALQADKAALAGRMHELQVSRRLCLTLIDIQGRRPSCMSKLHCNVWLLSHHHLQPAERSRVGRTAGVPVLPSQVQNALSNSPSLAWNALQLSITNIVAASERCCLRTLTKSRVVLWCGWFFGGCRQALRRSCFASPVWKETRQHWESS